MGPNLHLTLGSSVAQGQAAIKTSSEQTQGQRGPASLEGRERGDGSAAEKQPRGAPGLRDQDKRGHSPPRRGPWGFPHSSHLPWAQSPLPRQMGAAAWNDSPAQVAT